MQSEGCPSAGTGFVTSIAVSVPVPSTGDVDSQGHITAPGLSPDPAPRPGHRTGDASGARRRAVPLGRSVPRWAPGGSRHLPWQRWVGSALRAGRGRGTSQRAERGWTTTRYPSLAAHPQASCGQRLISLHVGDLRAAALCVCFGT